MKPKLALVNIRAADSPAPYLYSSYVLKAYLDKALKGAAEVEVLNFQADVDAQEAASALAVAAPDWVGYSCYVWNVERNLAVLRELRKTSDAPAIFGGPEISPESAKTLLQSDGPDYCVIGEGEKKLARLIQSLMNGAVPCPDALKGVAHLSDGEFAYFEEPEPITPLDEVPSPYLSGAIPPELYRRGHAFLETQRGCRHRCRYCVYHKNLKSISYYSLERVCEELDHLVIDSRVMALRILDPILTSDLERAKHIVRHLVEMKGRGVRRLPWIYWEFTPTSVDNEFLELLAELKSQPRIHNAEAAPALDQPQFYSDFVRGYCAVNCVGIQSFCPEALYAVRRMPSTHEEVDWFLDKARRVNIVLKIDLILGLPHETIDSYFEGLAFLASRVLDADHILNIHRLQILPGSELAARCGEFEVRYSARPPLLVLETNSMSEEELAHASRLTALLARIVNSPLRLQVPPQVVRTGSALRAMLETLFRTICESGEFEGAAVCSARQIDDDYWNGPVFGEIPSEWLSAYLQALRGHSGT